MVENSSRLRIKYFVAVAWLLFTLTFALWWMYFGLKQLSQVAALLPEQHESLDRHRRMMIWEGSAWMVLLMGGGATLIGYVAREARRSRELKEFFAAFSHDIKTSLASLRLQAESLQEDLAGQKLPVLDRLVNDTVRLNLQLQNSLFLSSHEDMKLFVENISLRKVIEGLKAQWPQLKVTISRDCNVRADQRALVSVLANLLQNAVVHGSATEFTFNAEQAAESFVNIDFHDNGRGFKGDEKRLAKLFYRHTAGSGSGVGLYISRELVKRMGGHLNFKTATSGFAGRLQLEGELV
ncbi:MAG: sensor histidine kinase [Bdellovibrionales bacterium]